MHFTLASHSLSRAAKQACEIATEWRVSPEALLMALGTPSVTVVKLWKQQMRSYLLLCKQGRGGERHIDCSCAFVWKYFNFKTMKI